MLLVLLTGQDKGSRHQTTNQPIFLCSPYQYDIQRSFHQEGYPSSYNHIYHNRETGTESRDCFSFISVNPIKSIEPGISRTAYGFILFFLVSSNKGLSSMQKKTATMWFSLTLTQQNLVLQGKGKLNVLLLCFLKLLPHVPFDF